MSTAETDERVHRGDDDAGAEGRIDAEAFFGELLSSAPIMYGPDPAITADNRIQPRSAREEAAMQTAIDPVDVAVTQNRVEAILESAKDMLQQVSAAPAAKWGDLIVGVYSLKGDLSICTSSGVQVFAASASPVPRFIHEKWRDEPTVGIREGDVFYHNDANYGGAHNPDHTLLLPLFDGDEQIGWIGAVIHEGENGAAVDPGGFAPRATTPYMEGLRIPPMKIGENHTLRRDTVNLFQNQVRDPLLWLIDMRSKLAACSKVEERLKELMAELSPDLLIATLRTTLENTEAEVKRRLERWPDGTYRAVTFADSTLLEDRLVKVACEVHKRGSTLTLRTAGSAPAIDRAINTQIHGAKAIVANDLMNFIWADLPRNAGFVSAVDFEIEPGSVFAATTDHPTSLSMVTMFYLGSAAHTCFTKALFGEPGTTEVIAPWFSMIPTLQYGGVTQHMQATANVSTELNGMGGGAHSDRDGEHAAGPFFASMADCGEIEDRETEIPVLGLWRRIATDNHGFGKYRGGCSFEWAYMLYQSPMFAFAVTSAGGRFPVHNGLFGGYANPCFPLTRLEPEGGLEAMLAKLGEGAKDVPFDAVELVRSKPIAGNYEVTVPGRPADLVAQGEVWIQRVGGGAGYGDPLERDPADVERDLRQGLISGTVAERVYHAVYDPESLSVDAEATERARAGARAERIERGRPYDEFIAEWRREAPPEDVPFLGSWEWSAGEEEAAA